MSDFTEVALVTGGARRIGRVIVEALAGRGVAVAIHARRADDADAIALARGIVAAGGRAAVVGGDLADEAAVARMIPAAEAALGPVTLLVNNASHFTRDEARDVTATSFDRHMHPNLLAPLILARDMAARLPAGREGAIVNIVDQRVRKLTPDYLSYTLSKAALATATVTLAQALAPRIRVNAVGPGPTARNDRQSPEDFAKQGAATPLGRGSPPEDIAAAVLYLATARSVTGQYIAVDGGQSIAWLTPDVDGIID